MVSVSPGRIEGELCFATADAVLRESAQLLKTGSIDLSGIPRADSAGVALLLELRRRHGAPLPLTQIPAQLGGLIEFFNLGAILMPPQPSGSAP